MKSYTQGRNQYGVWTKNTDSTNLTNGDLYANDDYRTICALKDWPFLERLRTLTTVASTQTLALPYDCDQVREIAVVPNGQTMRWTPKQSPDARHWDQLNRTQFTSDQAQWWRVFAGQLQLWPTPASSGNTVYVTQKTRVIDLSVADTTVTVTAVANAGTSVTVSSGATTLMTGQYIRIPYSGAANTGDGLWYEIAGVPNSTTLTLARAYGGTTISAGSVSSTIGQMPLLPESFHDLPWLQAAGTYWAKETDSRADFFLNAHGVIGNSSTPATGKLGELIRTWSSGTTDMVIYDGRDVDDFINPNLTVTL